MIESVIILLTLVLVGATIKELEYLDSEMFNRLGGYGVLYWPPSSFKFIFNICTGRLFGVFNKFPVKLFPYILFIECWIFIILNIKTRIL